MRLSSFIHLSILSLFLAFLFIFPHKIDAQVNVAPGTNEYMDSLDAIDNKDYEKAEELIVKAIELDPKNLEYRYVYSIILSLRSMYAQAIAILEEIISKSPKEFLKAYFDLYGIYRKTGEHQKAKVVMEQALLHHPNEGRVYLELGTLLKDKRDFKSAMENFEKAKMYDKSLEQLALLLIAQCKVGLKDYEGAKNDLYRAIEINPKSDIGLSSEKMMNALPYIKKASRPIFLNLQTAWTYDDRVTVEPLSDFTGNITASIDKSDQYETFYGKLGFRVLKREDMEIGFGYGAYNVGYKDMVSNSLFAHIPFFYMTKTMGQLTFNIPYEYYEISTGGKDNYQDSGFFLTFGNHAKKELKMHSVSPLISISHEKGFKTDINVVYQNKEYIEGTSPDSKFWAIGLTEYLVRGRITPRVGIKYQRESAEMDAGYYGWSFYLGATGPLVSGITWDILYTFNTTSYDREAQTGERKDKGHGIQVFLSRDITHWFSLYMSYNYYRNRSSEDNPLLRYEKNTISFGANFSF